ncbi:MAG TPA: SurA N-terminal domain-containing protein [Gemmatimonadales bacterium]|nr:SurA N-terminal domain-containing protein [Gemmatimonadales bacterium]
MLRALREKSKYIFYILALAFVGWLVFDVGMGVTGAGKYGGADVVLRVNGTSIHYPLYQEQLRAANEQYRTQNHESQLTREEEKQLEDQTVEQLIRDALMQQEYARLGITVSDEEIRDAARTSPPAEVLQIKDFQTNGQFDIQKWQRFLASGTNPEFLLQLEARYRDQIPQFKLLQYVTADVYVSDAKLWRIYRDEHDSVTVALVAIGPEVVPDSAVPISDAELNQYYTAHQDEFKRPATAYVSFVALPRRPNGSDSAAAMARATRLRAEVVAGGQPAFEAAAKRESSDTVSGSRGGDLGWLKRNDQNFDTRFMAGLKGLAVGQVSKPVLTQFGLHLIRIDAAKGDSLHVRHILVPIELAGAHRDSVEARADTLERLAAEHDDGAALDTAAKHLNLPLARAPRIVEGDRLQLGRWVIPNVGVWAFEARPGQTSPVYDAEPAFYVFRLDSLIPAGLPPLNEVRDQVSYRARLDKKRTLATARARQIAADLKRAPDLIQAAGARGLAAQRLGPFTRLSPPVSLQGEPAVLGAAFGLGVAERSDLIVGERASYILQSLSRKLADSSAWLAQRATERETILQAARQARVRSYIDGLRARAKVVDRRKDLFKPQDQSTAGS